MARMNARGATQIGLTRTTEWERPNDEGPATLYRELWKIRSDGAVLSRIVWTETPGSGHGKYRTPKTPDRLTHSSGFSIAARFSRGPKGERYPSTEALDAWLAKRGRKIVKLG